MDALGKVIASYLVNSLDETEPAGDATKEETQKEEPPKKGRYELHGIKIAFDAPNPRKPNAETFSKEPKKEYEANFMWVQYHILFTDNSGEDLEWYIYQAAMDPWGPIQTTIKNGAPLIIKSDSKWQLHKNEPVTITAKEVEPSFDVIKQSNEGQGDWLHPREEVTYLNLNKSDKGHVYSSNEFKQNFNKDFFVVLTQSKKFVNPFGKPIGQSGELPMEEEKVVKALKLGMKVASKEAYFTGGFDVMKKLYQDQKKNPGKPEGVGEGPETGSEEKKEEKK